MGITMDKLKEMVDVNTIIGEPLKLTRKLPLSRFQRFHSDLPPAVLTCHQKTRKNFSAEVPAQAFLYSLSHSLWFQTARQSCCRCL